MKKIKRDGERKMAKKTISCDLNVTLKCLNELRLLSDEINSVNVAPMNITSTGPAVEEIKRTWQLLGEYKRALMTLIDQSYNFTNSVYKNFINADQSSSVVAGAVSVGRIVGSNATVTSGASPSPSPTPDAANNTPSNSNESGQELSVPQRQWVHTTPKYVSDESNRSADNYRRVLEQFDVTHNQRYAKNVMDGKSKSGVTWCNIYAWDSTEAMGAEIPHWYNPNTGEPMGVGESGAVEMGTDRMNSWMDKFGTQNGWRQMTAAEAQQAANAGKPTIALSQGHVAMVAPSEAGYDPGPYGPRICQAGGSNFEYGTTKGGFGREYSQVRYFTHN